MIKFKPLIALIFILSFISCDNINTTRIIRLGHGLSTSHSVHKGMVYFGEKLEEISGGKLKVQIYPSQQLGTERQCLELLQIGSLDMTKVSAGVLENFSPVLRFLEFHIFLETKNTLLECLMDPLEMNYWLVQKNIG